MAIIYRQIILIGNYLPDKQESMQRFAKMLDIGFQNANIKSEIWYPKIIFGSSIKNPNKGFDKWLGYIDKWVLFPIILRWRLLKCYMQNTQTKFHICDHSNAPYLNQLPLVHTSVTCHDVLAIRSGLGYSDNHVTTSHLGKLLQEWILKSLIKSKKLASVSQFTLDQLIALAPYTNREQFDWRVIHNAFNAKFWPMQVMQAKQVLAKAKIDLSESFLLHVGSGLPRKNRSLILKMVYILGDRWLGNICFAGEGPDKELLSIVEDLCLSERVKFVVNPNHDTLVALYSTCEAFIFPSYSEGFGWPVIEAQACGAPVIASNAEPMPEVSGGAALHVDPSDPKAFAKALVALQHSSTRTSLVQQGFANSQRFELSHMMEAYLDLCQLTPA